MIRLTEKEIQQHLVGLDESFSINIFCDLHHVLDSQGLPTNQTFYSAIVQFRCNGVFIQNHQCVNVRDKRQLKKYRTWESLVNAFRWDDRCTVTFRTYELDDQEFTND